MDKLKDSIKELITEYEQAHALLNEQKEAIIRQDILTLNDLVLKQVEMYENLTQAEHKFKTRLETFHQKHCSAKELSLQSVLESLDGPTEMLNKLRDKLHEKVEKTEQMRQQLIELLNFAQSQNANLFKAICVIDPENPKAYDATGQAHARQTNGIAINQQI